MPDAPPDRAAAVADSAGPPVRRAPSRPTGWRRAEWRSPLLAPALTLGLLAITTGCYAGITAATQNNYQPGDGVDARSGPMKVRNLQVVSSGTDGTIVVGIANDGAAPDSIRSMTVAGRPVRFTLADTTILPQRLVSFGTVSGPQGFVSGDFSPGRLVPVTIVFADAGQVQVQVPVYPRYDYTSSVPTPQPVQPSGSPTITINASPAAPSSATYVPTPRPGDTAGLPVPSPK